MHPTAFHTVFSRLEASVEVVCDAATHVWLCARTRGYFSTSNTLVDERKWTVFVGAEFAPDSEWVSYTRSSPTGECCVFRVDICRRALVIDLPAGSWRRLYALRMVRNILRWELFLGGAIFLHASCVSRAGEGIAILGPSRSGKTTLTLNLLNTGHCGFVTEDDLTVVPQRDGSLLALGWPGCIRVRRHMLPHWPELDSMRYQFAHPANDLEKGLNPDIGLVRIFPEETAVFNPCGVVPEVRLQTCMWVEWGSGGPQVGPLSEDDIWQRLRGSWDILPERKAGARPYYDDGHPRPWKELVFDPFLLKSYGVPVLRKHEQALKSISQSVAGFTFSHGGDMIAAEYLTNNHPPS